MDNKISLSAMTELLQKLVSISSPYFHEDEIMDYVKGWLEERGLPAQLHTYHDSRVTGFHGTNVTGVLDGGKPGPVIYLNGHLDTVNICDGWTKDPLGGQVEDGKLYGTGALDMKSGCAAILLAVEAFAAEHKEFNGKIIYHLVSDEEGPYGLGTMFLIDDQWHRVEEIADIAISKTDTGGNGEEGFAARIVYDACLKRGADNAVQTGILRVLCVVHDYFCNRLFDQEILFHSFLVGGGRLCYCNK